MSVSARIPPNEQSLAEPCEDKRQQLGQFFTPPQIADLMATFFEGGWRDLNLLDAGAGSGSLTAAVVKRLCASDGKPRQISVTAYEVDGALMEPLRSTMRHCEEECDRAGIRFRATVQNEDFIAAAVPLANDDLFAGPAPRFNAAIVNPPYRKIRGDSNTRLLLRSAGIETTNLYTGFLALIARLLDDGGEIAAITPRSFCNGPYFERFRADFLRTMSLRRLHVFDSRSAAFRKDNVLQENVVVHAVKGAKPPRTVLVSSSGGASASEVISREMRYRDVVSPKDPHQFIHFAQNSGHDKARASMGMLTSSLPLLGLNVSTGRVVDFRAKGHLRMRPDHDTAPLIYPCHFNGGFVHWPKEQTRKPNAIVSDERTRSLLIPSEIYVLVKRFTAKEERRRIVACIYDPIQVSGSLVAFENHLNYFHSNGHGLSMSLAKGLAAFLNSTIVDSYFRQFNGHTQVNAADLRSLSYPPRAKLESLAGKIKDPGMPQADLDALVEPEIF